MGQRILASTVYVDGRPYGPGTAEGDLPDGIAEQITNPKAWREQPAGDPEPVVSAGQGITALGSVGQPLGVGVDGRTGLPIGAPPAGSAAAANLTDAADQPPAPPAEQLDQLDQLDQLGLGADAERTGDTGDAVPAPGAGQSVEPPPLSGPGSGAPAWREHAAALGVAVEPDAKRDDVVEAIRAAGHPVERSEQ